MKLVAVIAASFLTVASFAQSAKVETETETAGLIGKRYVSAGFGWTDINNSSVEGMGTGVDVNIPFHTNFDLTVGYSYSWLEGAIDLGHTASLGVTGYITRGENKYYATLSTGYVWASDDFDSDHGIWGARAGIERAVTEKISASFSVGYDDDFGQHRDAVCDVAIGGTYNITSKLVASAEVAYIEYGSVGYSAGLAYRF